MTQLRFDFRDIFRSPRLAFSLQRVWITFCGMTVGYLGYAILTYVSFVASGYRFSEAWNRFGLLPCLFGMSAPWYGWVIYAVGALFLVAAYMVTGTAVCRATYRLLKGDNFFTWREAFSFALKKGGSTLAAPVALIAMLAMFVIGALVVGLLGKIPLVGELGLSLFTFFWLVAALFVFYLLLILAISLILTPSVIATTDEDAFEAVFQAFSTAWSQPWRLVTYEALSGALGFLGCAILAYAVKRAFLIMNMLFSASMGDKFQNLAAQGQYLVQKWLFLSRDAVQSLFGAFAPQIYFTHEFFPLELPPILTISAYLFAISLVIAGGWVVSYPLAVFNVGNTLSYLVIRKKKDDENLLERKDKEEAAAEEKKQAVQEKKPEEETKAGATTEEKKA